MENNINNGLEGLGTFSNNPDQQNNTNYQQNNVQYNNQQYQQYQQYQQQNVNTNFFDILYMIFDTILNIFIFVITKLWWIWIPLLILAYFILKNIIN